MENIKNRYLILIALMLFSSVLVSFLNYDTDNKAEASIQTIEKIPLNLGKWHGVDVSLEENIYEILETKSIINRAYHTEKGKKVFLSIVYYPETKVDFHAPEACLAGQGIQISKTTKTIYITHKGRKTKINLNQLVRKTNNSNELIYYFYKAGDFLGKNYIKLRFALAMNKFSTKEKSGALIRISTPALNSDYQPASENLISFIAELYPYLNKYL